MHQLYQGPVITRPLQSEKIWRFLEYSIIARFMGYKRFIPAANSFLRLLGGTRVPLRTKNWPGNSKIGIRWLHDAAACLSHLTGNHPTHLVLTELRTNLG